MDENLNGAGDRAAIWGSRRPLMTHGLCEKENAKMTPQQLLQQIQVHHFYGGCSFFLVSNIPSKKCCTPCFLFTLTLEVIWLQALSQSCNLWTSPIPSLFSAGGFYHLCACQQLPERLTLDLETLIIYCLVKGLYNYNVWKKPKILWVFPQGQYIYDIQKEPKKHQGFLQGWYIYNVQK